MASPCLSGGGGGRAAYGFDLEIAVKSASYSASTSSPSSTLSESSNSPIAISTRRRKPRTPRKRPNQTYNEAAAILSTAYPKLFSAKPLPSSAAAAAIHSFPFDSADLLLPSTAADSRFLPAWEKVKLAKSSSATTSEVSSRDNSNSKEFSGVGGGGYELESDDFDAESILDEEIEEGGIDSIMGNLSVVNSSSSNSEESVNVGQTTATTSSFVYGYPPGFNGRNLHHWIGNGNGDGNGVRAFRRVDDWWSYPVVDVFQISPQLDSNYRPITATSDGVKTNSTEKKKSSKTKTKKKKLEDLAPEDKVDLKGKGGKLLLKLNYDDILKAWSGKDSPLPVDSVSAAGKQ